MQTSGEDNYIFEACKYALPAFLAQAAGKRQLTPTSRVRAREELTPGGQLARGRGDSCVSLAQSSTPPASRRERQAREGRSNRYAARTHRCAGGDVVLCAVPFFPVRRLLARLRAGRLTSRATISWTRRGLP